MRTCIVCDTEIDLEAARSTTGQTTHGADEVDPDAGTRSLQNQGGLNMGALFSAGTGSINRCQTVKCGQ